MQVLIVKTSSLGDIVHAFPCVSYIKAHVPSATVDWVVEEPFSSLVKAHPAIDSVFTIDTKSWRKNPFALKARKQVADFVSLVRQKRYDVVFDLQGNTKSAVATSLINSGKKIGFARKDVAEWPNLFVTHKKVPLSAGQNIRQDYLQLIQSYFGACHVTEPSFVTLKLTKEEKESYHRLIKHFSFFQRPWTLVCGGSNWKNKQLDESCLQGFLKLLHPHLGGSFFFAFGSEEEKMRAQKLQACFASSACLEKLSLPLLQNIMATMDLIIAVDSLPLHLAATTPVSTFSVFGPSAAAKYKPLGQQHRFLQGICPYGRTFEKRCPLLRTCSTGACLRSLQPKDLMQAFLEKTSK